MSFGEELIQRKVNYIGLLDSELEVLSTLTNDLVSLDMEDDSTHQFYRQGLYRIMETTEGLFLYTMTYLYSFDYLDSDVTENIDNDINERQFEIF